MATILSSRDGDKVDSVILVRAGAPGRGPETLESLAHQKQLPVLRQTGIEIIIAGRQGLAGFMSIPAHHLDSPIRPTASGFGARLLTTKALASRFRQQGEGEWN